MRTFRFLALTFTFILSLFAADIDGKWKASFTTPDGTARESTLTFKADGEKLSGSISGQNGETAFKDGTISGDKVEFSIVRNFGGNEMTFIYKGTLTGNKLALKVTAGEREFDMTAVKQ